jgi:RNA polymerase sigma factor (sigma-70 family)
MANAGTAALLAMLETHGAELHALFTRLTLRAGVADDLLQELFLKLRASEGFASAANQKAYVFRSAINLGFDWRRSQRPTEPLRTEPTSPGRPVLAHLIDAEELEQVLEAMQYISDLGRQVVVLRYLQQQEYAEIAEQAGKTEHQVRGICYKALEQLRAALQPSTSESGARGNEP